MDRLRHLTVLACLALLGCEEKQPKGPPPSRFDSVKSGASSVARDKALSSFCEVSFPAAGEGSKKWRPPPDRPLPKAVPAPESARAVAGWTWVNLWASWCGPCIKEMPLFERWRSSLEKDGFAVRFELWTVDAEEKDLLPALDRSFPGQVRWLRSEDDLPALLESLGVDKTAAIPIHALVDAGGNLRCVRVGSVGEESFAAVKAILAGG